LKTDHKFTRDENLICGFCQAMLHDYESAIEHFEAIGPVELMSDDVQALLATCYDSAGYFDSAIEVYVFLAEKQSYALNNYNYAVALSHGGYFDQAQDVLFEEDFLRPGQPKVERLLAWCSLKSANAEQAAKYYEKIISESAPKASDYFNAGHAALALGDVPKAVNYYKMSAATRASESANPSPIRLSDEDNAMLDALKVPRLVARLAIEAANSKDAR